MIELLNNRISIVAFVWKKGYLVKLQTPDSASDSCCWGPPEPNLLMVLEKRETETWNSSLSKWCCGPHTGPICSDMSSNTLIMPCRKKKRGWRCQTTQEDTISDVFRTVKMKPLWLGAFSEKGERFSTLSKYYLPFAHQLMAIFAESDHANSMTLIMNIKKE